MRGYAIHDERDYYFVTEEGYIIRTDMTFSPSAQWRVNAIFNIYGRRLHWKEQFESIIANGGDCRFKNGRGKYHIGDFDHGTNRKWGSRLMGVSRAEFVAINNGIWRKIG